MLNLHKLEVFLAVAREQKISRAAEALFMTQAAVSQHIHDLEQALGVELLRRHSHGVSLTPAGEVLLGYAQRILNLANDAEQVVSQLKRPASGQLRVGVSPLVAYSLGANWLKPMSATYPDIAISVRMEPPALLERGLAEEALDAILIADEELFPLERTRSAPLMEVRLGVVVSARSGWAEGEVVPLSALADHPWVMPPQACRFYQQVRHVFSAHELRPRVVAELDNFFLIQDAVAHGWGASVMPCREDCQMPSGLRWLSVPEFDDLHYTVRVVWADELPPRPVVCAFLRFLSSRHPRLHVPSACQLPAPMSFGGSNGDEP